jgi:hypothetical protein
LPASEDISITEPSPVVADREWKILFEDIFTAVSSSPVAGEWK